MIETKCDIVLLTYDKVDYSKACIESILKNTFCTYHLYVIDNGSVEQRTHDYLNELKLRNISNLTIVRIDKNKGYVKGVNEGLIHANSEYVVVMSNDTIAYPYWLSEMIGVAAQREDIGLVNPSWDIPKSKSNNAFEYAEKIYKRNKGKYIETDWIRGFCYLSKRKVIDLIGGLDIAFSPAYFDDWDYSVRAQLVGFSCVRALGSLVYHALNVTYKSTTNDLLNEKSKVFYSRYGRPLNLFVALPDFFQSKKIGEAFNESLKRQNKFIVLSQKDFLEKTHTNYQFKRRGEGVPMFLNVLFKLIDNVRHSKKKRFDAIFLPKRYKLLINLLFRGKYEVHYLDNVDNFIAEFKEIEKTKKRN
ncbi:MAG: glycosyltransferase [Candidatus Omnitrophica bacterium]|nr:glycosyltransferase [Candidatus Omnitrophota bacterium]